MSNGNTASREAIIAKLIGERGISREQASDLVELFEVLGRAGGTELNSILNASRGEIAGAKVAVRTISLSDLIRLDERPMKLPLAASSRPRDGIRDSESNVRMTAVFEHVPDHLRLFDGPDGVICVEESAGIDLLQIGPLWGRTRPSVLLGFSTVEGILYGDLRDLWEQQRSV
jgi:hypothetical protein